MKKNIRTILSMLLVLVFVFQFSGSLAWADDEVTGNEALVYELALQKNASEKPSVISAEQEAEALGGKSCTVELAHDDAGDSSKRVRTAMSRTPGSIVLNSLAKEDLCVLPPEGFFVSQLYLRGDELGGTLPKFLPLQAERERADLSMKAGAAADKDGNFNRKLLSTFSSADPKVYTLVIVLSPIQKDENVTVTVALDAGAAGSQTQVKAGDAFTASSADDTAERKFTGWKLSYANGASLLLAAGDSFRPYTDCRLEAQWKSIITITANTPVSGADGYQANGYTYSGSLREGDSIESVQFAIEENAGQIVSVPSGAVIRSGEKDVTADYELRYVASEPAEKQDDPTPAPSPEDPTPAPKTAITITANEPVLDSDGKTYVANGANYSGTLNEGDSIAAVSLDVRKTDAGNYYVVPYDAVIKNGEIDNTANYEITYVNSAEVTPPAPEKVKITITAKEPVLDSDGKTYVSNNATLTGTLNTGDQVVALALDVKKTDAGNYYVVPHDAVIKNGEIDNTANYEITYVNSAEVTPEAEKIAITIRSKDRTEEYTGKPVTANEYELTSGALAQGDTIEVQYAGGSTDVTASPVASTISSVVIKDSEGKDVTASKYAVTIDNDHAGKVTVTKRSITVTAISGKVETDGNTVIYAKDCKTSNGEFKNGHKVEGLLTGHELRGDFVKGSGKETFVTSIDLSALRIVDTANGNADITANYDVKTVDGKMTIVVSSQTGVPVAVTVSDQSWTYNGAANKPDQTKYNISGLLDGDVATVTLKIKQGDTQVESVTNAGTYSIVPVVTIQTKDGKPVAENKYKITAGSATLTVKKMDITLEAVSDSKPYDGKALVNDKVKASPLASGHKYQGVKLNVYDAKGNLIKNGAKEVGTYVKRITEVHVVDANGNEVTENYNITKVDGKLTITNSSKNDSKTPKTGDTSVALYIVLLIASLLLLGTIAAFLIVRNRRRQKVRPAYDGEYYETDEQQADWQQAEYQDPNFQDPGFQAPEYPEQPPESWTEATKKWNIDPQNGDDR